MSDKKPIIGVTPLWDDNKSSIWMLPDYMDAVRESGGVPIILPLVASREDILQICDMCDGFLLTGGHDIDPALYGESRHEKCGDACLSRDTLERIVLNYAIDRDLPLLGICRGIQIINALCGGDLYQDLPSQHHNTEGVEHQMTPPYSRPIHSVRVVEGSPLHHIVGTNRLEVNSYHHQAIKTLAPNLEAMAVSEDGIVEAIYMPSRGFIVAVQWHPEFSFHDCEFSRKIVESFIDKTQKS